LVIGYLNLDNFDRIHYKGGRMAMKRSTGRSKKVKEAKTGFKSTPVKPVRGLDIGTSFINCAENQGGRVKFRSVRNAFFDIDYTDFTTQMLNRAEINYIKRDGRLYVTGTGALEFANIFNKEVRRPLKRGVISPKEKEALPLVEILIKSVLGPASRKEELVHYSVPGEPVDADFNLTYHETVLAEFLRDFGYTPKPINEGLAVVFSELDNENFTGIGISFGGGMVNVCMSFMATPVFSFSISKSGDWIDSQAAMAVDETNSKICAFKEKELDLTKKKGLSRIEKALSVYYDNLIEYVLRHLKQKFENTKEMPNFKKPINIAISGGTSVPKGFLPRFNQMIEKINLPHAIGRVSIAEGPMNTVANGALIAAIADGDKK